MAKPKEKKSLIGRPTIMTEAVVQKLEEWFKNDFTDGESCSYAWISREVYYLHCRQNKDFLHRMERAKDYCFILAKKNVLGGINNWDEEYSLKRLKNRQNKIYSERNETNPQDVNININFDSMTDEELLKFIQKK